MTLVVVLTIAAALIVGSVASPAVRQAPAAGARDGQANLIQEIPGQAPRIIPLREHELAIGRGQECRLRIEGALVSRRHARIVHDRARRQWMLIDDDSTNGTYVNGQRVGKHVLRAGDVVQIGRVQLRFQEPQIGSPGAVLAQRPSLRESDGSIAPRVCAISPPAPAAASPAEAAGDSNTIPGYIIFSRVDGGHGSVFRARSVTRGWDCAIKVLRLTNPFLIQKFEQEVRLLSGFNHPHVVRALESGLVQGRPFVVMEYCSGGNLRRLMNQKRLQSAEIVRIIGQACHGVHYAHSHRVIHRDLKPEHIMFDAHGNVKVVDFGIAKSADSLIQTSYGMVLGTPAYLSPEQARGQRVDLRTDIYALGVILYEALVGRAPFTGSNTGILEQHMRRPPPPPQTVLPTCDARLASIAMRALEKSPDRRFQSALEMANALGYSPSGSATGSRPAR